MGRAFTLLELIVVVAIMTLVAALAASSMRPADGSRLASAAAMLASDLEYVRSASIAAPENPSLLRVSGDGALYWVGSMSAPDAAQIRPDGQAYEIRFGSGLGAPLAGVTATGVSGGTAVAARGKPAREYAFDAFGRLLAPGDARIEVRNAAGMIPALVSGTTGDVTLGPREP